MRNTILSSVFLAACCASYGQPAAARVEFEVASIKPSQLSKLGEGSRRESISADPGSVTMRNVSLKSALLWAYSVRDYQVSGTGWLGDERYDILAKATSATDEPQLRRMLQTLLTDRFKMTIHHETKVLPEYVLIVDKNGPKLTEGNPQGKSNMQPNGTKIVITDTSIVEIADLLSNTGPKINIGVPVVDETGLKGRYNFTIDAGAFLQRFADASATQPPDPDAVINAVREVLQSQLGIKAELRKAPADVIVVDRAEKVPVEN